MSQPKRSFDWGPPTARWADSLKEWALYPVLLVLLALGAWFLFAPADFEAMRFIRPPDRSAGGSAPAGVSSRPPPAAASPPGAQPSSPSAPTSPVPLPETTSPPSPPPPPSYIVQVGAFGDEESARDTMQRIRDVGFETILSEPSEQFDMFRLLMGPYASELEAEKAARQLNELEFYAFVIESP
jgi:cell division septation protein DedD